MGVDEMQQNIYVGSYLSVCYAIFYSPIKSDWPHRDFDASPRIWTCVTGPLLADVSLGMRLTASNGTGLGVHCRMSENETNCK